MSLPVRLSLSVLVALAACAPPALYHKPGADPAMVEANLTRCEVAALQEVPRDMRTRFHPPTYSPFVSCNAHGHCLRRFHMLSPGRTETYDANAGLRARVVDQCMAEAGFRPVRLPQCEPGTKLPAVASQPVLGENSCALRLSSGRWHIVTPQ